MPTVQEPTKQAPMEAVTDAGATSRPSGEMQGPVVTRQPTAEPQPDAEPNLKLRGGGMSLGFDCCGGACRFHKSCC